ncbi:MAG TPA: ribonuclease HII [Streptosporangiaceae bacterium]|nr:ribonuclease HII [Streptosporangiaceae bacterium]
MRASSAQAARARAIARAKAARKAGGPATGGRSGRSRSRKSSRAGSAARSAAAAGLGDPWLITTEFGDARPLTGWAAARIDVLGSGLAGLEDVRRPVAYTPRRGGGLTGYERVLVRAGLGPVAGIDEAGRGACAGPLVVAAVAIDRWSGDSLEGIADSKVLTARARESAYRKIVRSALAWHVVVIEPGEIDRLGLHVCNVAGMRRALAGLTASPGYVLTDGFVVPGLAVPALAMWKGDQVAASVAAASIVAKVTRDKIMTGLHADYPDYGFARHKGYSTPSHMAALDRCGPSPVHRRSFVNVSCRLGGAGQPGDSVVRDEDLDLAEGVVLADGSLLALDEGADGPIVELTADPPATAPGNGGAEDAGEAARNPAAAEGRT